MSSAALYLIGILFVFCFIHATNGHGGHATTYEQKRAVIDQIKATNTRPEWMSKERILRRSVCQSSVCEHSSTAEKATLSGIKIILCGTGQPFASNRGRACTAIQAGDEVMVFDVGMGAELCLVSFNNTDYSKLTKKLFLTHYHSDHTGGVPNFLALGGTRGYKLEVYGPNSTLLQNFTEGMRKFYVMDALQHEIVLNYSANYCQPTFHSPAEDISQAKYDSLQFNSRPFDPPPMDNTTRLTLYENTTTGLKVEAFRVYHHSADPAVGYRITYNGKVIVVSGDTAGYPTTTAVLNAAMNADVLVHEIINKTYVQNVLGTSAENLFFRTCQLLDSHSAIDAVATVAQMANVKQLLITHLVPSPATDAESQLIKTELQKTYTGPILVANDYDYFLL